jgi:hypothetical protein
LSGLTAGTVYFLSPSSAGALTATAPTTVGQVSKPLLIAYTTTAGYFFDWRGEVLASNPTGYPSGTSFPGSPSTNDIFYRTDLALLFFYDGTRWLTTTLYVLNCGFGVANSPTGNDGYNAVPTETLDIWLVSYIASTYVVAPNDGSNFYTCHLNKTDAGNSNTSVASFTTAADTQNNWTRHVVAIGAALGGVATYKLITTSNTKTSAPGDLYHRPAFSYRMIGT